MDGRFVATLALDYSWHLRLDDLVACLRQKVPALSGDVSGCAYGGDMAGADEAYMISVSGRHFAVAYISAAAPPGRFNVAAAYAAERWPDAVADMAGHRAQIVVSNLEPARSFYSAIEAAGSITLIAGVLAEIGPALGVHWPAGEVLHTPKDFSARADALIEGQPPVDAWITVRAHVDDYAPDAAPGIGVSTLGMNRFCRREIEILSAPVATTQARDRVTAIAADILKNGPGLADDCTIRIGDTDLIRVNLVDKGRFSADQPVILLSVPEDQTDAPEPAAGVAAGALPLFQKRRRNKPFAT